MTPLWQGIIIAWPPAAAGIAATLWISHRKVTAVTKEQSTFLTGQLKGTVTEQNSFIEQVTDRQTQEILNAEMPSSQP